MKHLYQSLHQKGDTDSSSTNCRGKIIKTETIFGLDDGVQKHSGIHFSVESGNLMQADNMEGEKMHLFLLATYT